jgi:hypothetical protein
MAVITVGVMVRLIRTDPDSAASFSPACIVVLCLIVGFLFSEREGQWEEAKPLLKLLSGLVILVGLALYAFYWVNTSYDLASRSHHPYVASSLDTNRPSLLK